MYIYALVLIMSILINVAKGENSHYYTFIDSISYRLDPNLKVYGKNVKFLFPPLGTNKEYTIDNLESVKLEGNNSLKNRFGCTVSFNNVNWYNDSGFLNIKLYAINIDTLYISISDINNQEFELMKIKLNPGLKYHLFNYNLGDIFNSEKNLLLDKVKNMNVFYYKKNKYQRLILNDLQIYNSVKIISKTHKGIAGAILNHYHILANNKSFKGFSQNITRKNIGYLEGSNNIYMLDYPINRQQNEIEDKISSPIVDKANSINEVNHSVKSILINYFNNTENSKKKYLLNEFDEIIRESSSLDDYYRRLNDFLIKIGDIHLSLVNRYGEKLKDITLPIYFHKMNKDIIVCGVYDTLLINKINLGDKLVSINDLPINSIIDKLEVSITGSTHETRALKVIQKLLAYVQQDFSNTCLNLKFIGNEGEIYSVILNKDEIFANSRLKLPKEIVENSKRFRYEQKGNIAYLRIGRFNQDELKPFLYSVIDSIMASRSLIIDIRNNSGGDISGAFLFSFFIDRPEVFFTTTNLDNNLETFMVNPDPYYQYTKPIAIIYDSRTTCGAEFFMSALSNSRSNIKTFSSSKSAGSAQSVKYLNLPVTQFYNVRLAYRNDICLNSQNDNLDVNGGIMPDVWVSLNSYYDLATFNDKLLNTAIEWLSYFTEDTPKEANILFCQKTFIWICILIFVLLINVIVVIFFFKQTIKNDFK